MARAGFVDRIRATTYPGTDRRGDKKTMTAAQRCHSPAVLSTFFIDVKSTKTESAKFMI
jgi:hypothetical protein